MDAKLFPDLRKRKELEKSGQGIVRYRGFENCEKGCRFRIVTNRPCGCSGVRDACSGTVWIPDTKVINDIIDTVNIFKASIRSFNVNENGRNGTYEIALKLSVPSNLELDKVISRIRTAKNVIKVSRG